MTRRNLLQAFGAAALVPSVGLALPSAKRKFRFVHMTDLHIQPELRAAEGVAQAVRKMLSLRVRPDFVITGGDHVMDVLSASAPRADEQFKLLRENLKPLEMPVHAVVGNHDVYGWGKADQDMKDPRYGRAQFAEQFKQARMQSWEFGGWRFITLDSIQPKAKGWSAGIDDDQLNWLKNELESTRKGTPIVVTTHVPLVTAFNQVEGSTTDALSNGTIIDNGAEVTKLLLPYNVKVVLQGHTHVQEEVSYGGIRFITSGAVCGNWWKGSRFGRFPEGFNVIDVDGESIKTEYITYGWKAPN
jgi:3',5'-cyclic AMP phosphodiesterase CpdA